MSVSCNLSDLRSTTILCVKKEGTIVIASDGQVTMGDMVCKANANKIKKLHQNTVLAGFAGSVGDSLALASRLEGKLKEYSGDLMRSVIELCKEWRGDKYLKKLESQMIVANLKDMMYIGGNGEAIEIDDGVASVGSGSKFALAAASALFDTNLTAREIVEKSMKIASNFCVYTNSNFTIESISTKEKEKKK